MSVADLLSVVVCSYLHGIQPACLPKLRLLNNCSQDAFNGPLKVLGHLLFEHIKTASTTKRRASIHLDEFLQVASDVLGLLTNSQQLNYYYDVFSNHSDHITVESKTLSTFSVAYDVTQWINTITSC